MWPLGLLYLIFFFYSNGRLAATLYDKRDEFNFAIITSTFYLVIYHCQLLMACISLNWFDTQEHVLRMRNFQSVDNNWPENRWCRVIKLFISSRLKSSIFKFYGRYNDLVCNYKLSMVHMLNTNFIPFLRLSLLYWLLTTNKPIYRILTNGARWMWPVSRRCLLLHDNWSYVRILSGVHVALQSILYLLFGLWLRLIHC
jgi:hypothetical protein